MDTGIARKIDDLGRIVIPAETRRLFNIHEGDQLGISVEGDAIVIRKLEATCTFCGTTDDVGSFKGKGVCAGCRAALRDADPCPSIDPSVGVRCGCLAVVWRRAARAGLRVSGVDVSSWPRQRQTTRIRARCGLACSCG